MKILGSRQSPPRLENQCACGKVKTSVRKKILWEPSPRTTLCSRKLVACGNIKPLWGKNPLLAMLAEKPFVEGEKFQAVCDICYIQFCMYSLKRKCLWRGRLWAKFSLKLLSLLFCFIALLSHICNDLLTREPWLSHHNFSDTPSITFMWTKCKCE